MGADGNVGGPRARAIAKRSAFGGRRGEGSATHVTRAGADSKEAIDELKKTVVAGDQDGAGRAVAKLREIGGKDAVEGMVALALKIPPGQESFYWLIVNGAAGFNDEVVTDFEEGVDLLAFAPGTFEASRSTFASTIAELSELIQASDGAVTAAVNGHEDAVVVDFGNGDTLTLIGFADEWNALGPVA